jgi:hypothetical protein
MPSLWALVTMKFKSIQLQCSLTVIEAEDQTLLFLKSEGRVDLSCEEFDLLILIDGVLTRPMEAKACLIIIMPLATTSRIKNSHLLMKTSFKSKLLSRVKSLKSRKRDMAELEDSVEREVQYILKLENEVLYKISNKQLFDAEIIFIYYFETCLALSDKLLLKNQPSKALKHIEGPCKIMTRKFDQVVKGDKHFFMMYKLYDKWAHCYAKLKKIILTLKCLKIALTNALKVQKILRSEINFPGLYFNVSQSEFSLGFISMALKSINLGINKEYELIEQHENSEGILFSLWIKMHLFKATLLTH